MILYNLEPNGKSVVAAGIYMPPSAILSRIRAGIDSNSKVLKDALETPELLALFNKKDSCMEMFLDGKDALKTAPKGYAKDHQDIDLLRLKTFTLSKKFDDSEVVLPDFPKTALAYFKAFMPLVYAINSYLEIDGL